MRSKNRTRLVGALTLVITLLSGSAWAEADSLEAMLAAAHRETLDNGLTLLVSEQPGSGVVAINTWVKAGYFNEPDEVAGMAHLFEHMFFKGSKAFPEPESIAGELAKIGGRTNAGTIYNSTNYYFVVPKESFRRGLEIQADALINPLFNPEELAKEAEVVIEESNRKLDRPGAVSIERMFATAFNEHRIRRWRIGSNEVLRNIQRDDLMAFFETLYRPENLILSIAGDISAEDAAAAAKETFGALPRGVLKKERGPKEPPQESFRYGQSSADLTQGYSVIGWHTVGESHDDEMALDVLSSILGSGRSSRLYRGVVGPEGAATSRSSHYVFDDIGVLFVQSSFDEPRRAEVDRQVLVEIERLRESGPTDYELALAMNQVESDLVFALEDALGQARTLAYYQARGDIGLLAEQVQEIRNLTTEQIRDVARRYLTLDNATLYHYLPEGTETSDRETELARSIEAISEVPARPAAIDLPADPTAIAPAKVSTGVQQFSLENGASLIVEPRMGPPIVSVGVFFPGGRLQEHSANAGVTQLMASTMVRGTSHRTAEEIDREIEYLGTSIGRSVDSDYFGFTVDILTRNLSAGVELLADVILNPTFDEAELEEQRHLQRAAIKRSMDSSFQRPFQLLAAQMYGSHPYGLPSNGDPTSLASLQRQDLQDWWKSTVVADGAAIVVVGNVDPSAVKDLLDRSFEGLAARASKARDRAVPVSPTVRVETSEFRDRKQSAIVLAYRSVPKNHADWPGLGLIGNITSGLSGTFFQELRGRQSLAYTIFFDEFSLAEAGMMFAYLATDADKEDRARAALLHEIQRLQTDGVTDADVARAQAYRAGSTRISLQSNDARLANHAENFLAGLGLDFTDRTLEAIAALSIEDVRELAKKYLAHDHYVVGTLKGKEDGE